MNEKVEKEEFDDLIKIVLVGNDKVGKTKFLKRLMNDEYTEEYGPTVNSKSLLKKFFFDYPSII